MKVVTTSPSFAKYSDEPVAFLEKHGIELVRLPEDMGKKNLLSRLRAPMPPSLRSMRLQPACWRKRLNLRSSASTASA
ncbi:hypothetical protein LJK88_16250 [Paenibacillus sp. P26]|nr:hypothetical protein LJK88_16250 [Paenibacillus sp. P26]